MRKFMYLLATVFMAACGSTQAQNQLDWVGTFEVVDKTIVANRDSPTLVSFATELTGNVTTLKRLSQTTSIVPRVGYGFGIQYELPQNGNSEQRAVMHFPSPGLLDQRTGRRILRNEWSANCVNAKCTAVYNFEHESELLPGTWRIEIWNNQVKTSEHKFTLVR